VRFLIIANFIILHTKTKRKGTAGAIIKAQKGILEVALPSDTMIMNSSVIMYEIIKNTHHPKTIETMDFFFTTLDIPGALMT
jgi:hypothetical protein